MNTRKERFYCYFKVLITFVLLSFAVIYQSGLYAGDVSNNNPDFDYKIELHDLDISLDVVKHFISSVDKMKISLSGSNSGKISFMLNSSLKVTQITIQGHKGQIEWDKSPAGNNIQIITARLPESVGDNIVVEVEYEGEIYDPVITAKELGHLRGDVTAGLICEEGVYLSASTYWYPVKSTDLSMFNINVRIQYPYIVVTQGELTKRKVKGGYSISKWKSHIPADGLALVAGKYIIHTTTVDNIKVSTYFFEEDDGMSDLFLNAAVNYVKLYSGVLGKYPYKKFDVVENFFSTGYGMPSYTLLGNYVIKRGQGSLDPGYLDHEVVHSWFGNYVFNDVLKGNWVEALTTYCANYYYKELKLGAEQARDHRENASLKYSIRVSKDKDYPVGKFVTKTMPFDNEIGYTKGSMVFHQLRQTIGDEAFFTGLKELVIRFGGKYAEWEDLQKVFEDVSKKKLDWFFSQWINQKGAPELKLENIYFLVAEKGYLVKADIVQLGDVFKLKLQVRIDLGKEAKILEVDIDKQRETFESIVDEIPFSISIDPDYHLFRRVAPEDIIPCLNAFLEDEENDKLFVFPTSGITDDKESYYGLAESAKGQTGSLMVSDSEISQEKLKNSIFLTGNARNSEKCKGFFDNLPEGVRFGKDSFSINGEEYSGHEYSLLFTYRNPLDKSNFVTTYFGLSPQAISRSRYIFFYGWDSYVVFKNGIPVKRGSFRSDETNTVFNLPDALTGMVKSEHIMEHIKYLASKKLAGRYPATQGDYLAKDYIKEKFKESLISPINIDQNKPYEQNFGIIITDLKDFQVSFQNKKTKESITAEADIFNFSPFGEFKLNMFFAGYGISNPQSETGYDDYKEMENMASGEKVIILGEDKNHVRGKAVVIMDGKPDFLKDMDLDGIDLLFHKIKVAQEKGAKAIIVYASPEQIKAYAPYLTYPSRVPESLMEGINRKKENGSFSTMEFEHISIVSKNKAPSFEVTIPIILKSFDSPDYENIKESLDIFELRDEINKSKNPQSKFIDDQALDMKIVYRITGMRAFNIVGVIEGRDPKLKDEIVVLGAHYDHLGTDKDGNIFFGADDNASGVGVLLETASNLSYFKDQFKRTIMFVAFGAEEWGLLGSHFFTANPISPDKKIVSMINMDSIGKGDPSKVWVIGSSFYPELGNVPVRYMKEFELFEGDNIDKHAFKYGSDHYPFHLKGIPAIDLFSTNYRELHKVTDTWEKIDKKKVEKISKLVFMTVYDLATKE